LGGQVIEATVIGNRASPMVELESPKSLPSVSRGSKRGVELKDGPFGVCLRDQNLELRTRLASSVGLCWCWWTLWVLRQLKKGAISWSCLNQVVQWSRREKIGTVVSPFRECWEPCTQIWSWNRSRPTLALMVVSGFHLNLDSYKVRCWRNFIQDSDVVTRKTNSLGGHQHPYGCYSQACI